MKQDNQHPPRKGETSAKSASVKNDKLAANVQASLEQLKKDVKAGDRKAAEFQKLLNAFRKH